MATDSTDFIDILSGGNEAAKTASKKVENPDNAPESPSIPQSPTDAEEDRKMIEKEVGLIGRLSATSDILLGLALVTIPVGLFLWRYYSWGIGSDGNWQIIATTIFSFVTLFGLSAMSRSLALMANSITRRMVTLNRYPIRNTEPGTLNFAGGLFRWGGVMLAVSAIVGCFYDIGHNMNDLSPALFCIISTIASLIGAWIIERVGDMFYCLSWCNVAIKYILAGDIITSEKFNFVNAASGDNQPIRVQDDPTCNSSWGPFTFSGRARRCIYWGMVISNLILLSSLVLFFDVMDNTKSNRAYELLLLTALPFIIWSWVVQVRRCHDLGWRGWVAFAIIGLNIIPFVGWLLPYVILGFKDSQPFTNKYGPDPKGRNLNGGQPSQSLPIAQTLKPQ